MERYVGAGFKLCWSDVVVIVLLILCSCSVPAAFAQSQSDFLNIDCGATAKYVDNATRLTWVPDDPYITTGNTTTVAFPSSLNSFPEMKTLRYFDDLRPKNCYTLPVTPGSTYLLRMTFYYGNYDNANQAPAFQLAIDATILANITNGGATYSEYHYVAQGNVSYVCLVRTSPLSTPFISGISLKPANGLSATFADQYGTFLQDGVIMKTLSRVNFGGTQMIRAPDDFYDRFWVPESQNLTYYLKPTTSPIEFLSTNSTFDSLVDAVSWPPSAVMQTAVTSSGTITSFLLQQGWNRTDVSVFLSFYYGELNSAAATPPLRNFTLQVEDLIQTTIDMTGYVFLNYGDWNFWNLRIGPNTTMAMTPLASSVAGPILNAMEVFEKFDSRVSKTVDRDALAIESIKTSLNLTEWTGDPCLPSPHPWITCTPPDLSTQQPHITAVNLSGYQLEGTIPASFDDLWDLTSLSLDNNNLSGPLPEWLATFTDLRVLSVQNNNFSGPIPEALLSANSNIRFTYMPGNPLLIIGGGPLPAPSTCANCGKSNVAAIVGATVGGVVGLIFILIVAIFAYRRCQRKRNLGDDQGASTMRLATTGGAKAYTFAEVTAATSHFNMELGKGGFGPVYYGKLPDGQEVAVKVADGSSKHEGREFFNEVDVLSRVHHKNLVAFVGYCQEQKQILIYEYMHHGSLFDHLHGSSVNVGTLDWRMRLHIALNAAQGLEYLHTACSPSFIHRDVKSSNILLSLRYEAKVADFGLTKLLSEAESARVVTDVMGTAGYLDPEYYTTQYISSKSDVYSFGIVLLELITGRMPIDHRSAAMGRNPSIAHWVRESLLNNDMNSILDPMVKASNPNMEAVWKVAEVAMQSVEPKGVHRPTMTEVVQELQGALTLEGMSSMPPANLHSQLPSGFTDYSSGSYGPTSYPAPR